MNQEIEIEVSDIDASYMVYRALEGFGFKVNSFSQSNGKRTLYCNTPDHDAVKRFVPAPISSDLN